MLRVSNESYKSNPRQTTPIRAGSGFFNDVKASYTFGKSGLQAYLGIGQVYVAADDGGKGIVRLPVVVLAVPQRVVAVETDQSEHGSVSLLRAGQHTAARRTRWQAG